MVAAAVVSPLPLPVPADRYDAAAADAVEAVVEAGARLLIAEPWRVARIIRGADAMTYRELTAETARRRALPPPADFNRVLALAQLARALEAPPFAAAFASCSAACARAPCAPR
jgi:hypothetical protein